jgi:uncharacterized protein (DUF58 family)
MVQAVQNSFAWSERGQAAAFGLPPMLVKAEKIANTVIVGVHGRKRTGPGESFWQFRPYTFGDSTHRIDWRRSALSDRVYIRETEWEAANTLWLWTSASSRMNFKSQFATETKKDRAQLFALATASLAIRAHERIGGLGSPRRAAYGRGALLRMAEWLLAARSDELPAPSHLQRQSAALLISDFLDELTVLERAFRPMAEAGIRGHLVQVCDPIEEIFPFEGRIEFLGLEKGLRYVAPKTQSLKEAYQEKYLRHREAVRALARSLGWSFTVHRTDQSLPKALLAVHEQVSGSMVNTFNGADAQ